MKSLAATSYDCNQMCRRVDDIIERTDKKCDSVFELPPRMPYALGLLDHDVCVNV